MAMDCDFLHLHILKSPWKNYVRSLLVDSPCSPDHWKLGDLVTGFVLAGETNSFETKCELGYLSSVLGLKFYTQPLTATVTFDSIDATTILHSGLTFGFEDALVLSVQPYKLVVNDKTKIWYIPDFCKELPLSVCHQYAGAYDGWGRAFDWLQNVHGVRCNRSIAVDIDHDVMQVWSLRTSQQFWTKVPLDHRDCGEKTGVASSIQDHSWFNLCRSQTNMVFTLSPPCQPWSQGGRGIGIESDNGMCFVHSIYSIKLIRPLIVFLEGADSTPSHKHFCVLRAGLISAGYKQVWSTVSHYHEISSMNRSRWLAVWVRSDIQSEVINGSFLLSDCAKCAWSDEMYSFHVPSQMEHQLFLSHHLEKVYGNFKWLPKSKRHGLSVLSSLHEVLAARCIRPQDVLPTLCASYSQQHDLAVAHLDTKGIFAVLVRKQGRFAFVDPIRFISLFGTPSSQIAILPTKINLCFHQLGNAITVPHALLAILVGLTSVSIVTLPITRTVLQCWCDRALSQHMIVLRNADFLFVASCDNLHPAVSKCLSETDGAILIQVVFSESTLSFHCQHLATFAWVVSQIGIVDPQAQGLTCHSNFRSALWDSNVGDFEGCTISITKGLSLCFKLMIPLPSTQSLLEDISENVEIKDVLTHQHSDFIEIPVRQDDERIAKSISQPENIKCAVFTKSEPFPFVIQIPSNASEEFVSIALKRALQIDAPDDAFRWYVCNSSFGDFQKVLLVDLHNCGKRDLVLILTLQNGTNPKCIEDKKVDFPINFPISENIFSSQLAINEAHVNPFLLTNFHDGDVVNTDWQEQSSAILQQVQSNRIALFKDTGVRAASDEISFAIDLLKISNQDIHVAPIADIRSQGCGISFLKLQQAMSGVGHLLLHHVNDAIVPIYIHDHWCALEFRKNENCIAVISVGVPQAFDARFRKIAADALAFPEITVAHFTMPLPSFEGLCGWVLLRRWFARFAPEIVDHLDHFCRDKACKNLLGIACTQDACFQQCPITERILRFADKFRTFFIASFVCQPSSKEFWPDAIVTGGMNDDVDPQGGGQSSSAKKDDPWSSFDPWMQKTGLKQAKWEDLRLPTDHPFVSNDGSRIKQVHKQKLSNNTGGIAFATKASLPELMKIEATDPVAILVPNGERKINSLIQPTPDVSGPFEVVVEDPVSGQVYKRQVLLIQTKPMIKFQLSQPTYTATLPELHELVLEIDSRFATRDLSNLLAEKPLDAFRARATDQYPPNTFQGVKIYAYRKFTPAGSDASHVVHQAMCKLPADKRIIAIERSGLGFITCRDFLGKGEVATDLTVIPRFWSIDKGSKDEAIRAVTGLEGFAGLIVSRRGLAARSWTSKIAVLRKALLPQDERISDLNIAVVPRVLCDSTGWPISISPTELIKATYHAVKLAPVPTRCHRLLGVTCWQLAFAEDPKVTKFVVKFNSQLHEILLTQPGSVNPLKQGKKQNPKKSASSHSHTAPQQPVPHVQDDAVAERVSILEAKFQTFEKRQETVERQLESGFESLQSQLRQVLNAVSQNRDKSPTGETPPPKHPRTL